jgi:hypothetical protein
MAQADAYKSPYLTYAAVDSIVSAAAQPKIAAALNVLKAAINPTINTGGTGNAAMLHPDFNKIPRNVSVMIAAEIDAIIAVIALAPTA